MLFNGYNGKPTTCRSQCMILDERLKIFICPDLYQKLRWLAEVLRWGE